MADETNSGTLHNKLSGNFDINIKFRENHAHISGSILFGGLLDRCTVSPFAEVYNNDNSPTIINGATYFRIISTFTESSISSHRMFLQGWST